ncbi:MAG: hypothetical protein KIT17_17625 [Rubrivivax sp.]|nr:hypothetical protein [Rubrivivax sp.]
MPKGRHAIPTERRRFRNDLRRAGFDTAAMTLNPQPTYPSQRSYVLKLHRDARPQDGLLRGRLEHIASGEGFDFADAAGLLAALARHAAALAAGSDRQATVIESKP